MDKKQASKILGDNNSVRIPYPFSIHSIQTSTHPRPVQTPPLHLTPILTLVFLAIHPPSLQHITEAVDHSTYIMQSVCKKPVYLKKKYIYI